MSSEHSLDIHISRLYVYRLYTYVYIYIYLDSLSLLTLTHPLHGAQGVRLIEDTRYNSPTGVDALARNVWNAMPPGEVLRSVPNRRLVP